LTACCFDTLQNGGVTWLMHNSFMPLSTAVANSSKAALVQGGFFVFAEGDFYSLLS
jgi:hypothetical protein